MVRGLGLSLLSAISNESRKLTSTLAAKAKMALWLPFCSDPPPFGITVRRGVVRGVLTSRNLVGPLKGKTIRDLIREIKKGNAYVNAHTIQNPDGEIRGQIKKC